MVNTRKNRRNGFLGRLYSPLNRGLQAVGSIGKEVTSTVGDVFNRTVTGVRRVGNTATSSVNKGVGELVKSRRRQDGGRRRGSRKTRKGGRKSRRNNMSMRSRRNRH